MAFCGICGNYHDPDLPCLNEAKQTLRGAGIEDRPQKAGPEFRKIANAADRFVLKVLVAAVVGLIALIVLATLLSGIR